MRKDLIVYYVINDKLFCEGYFYGGILSHFFAKRYFNYLCKKYPNNSFILKCDYLSNLIEECEGLS